MNKEQQIEEMARVACEHFDCDMVGQPCTKCKTYDKHCYTIHQAEILYNAGYRKVSESEAELQELNIKYYNEAKNLRRDLADFDKFARQISETRIELTGEAVPTCKTLLKYIETEKSKTVKEFVEKLKKKVHNYYPSIDSYCTSRHVILVKDIDELLKEYDSGK